MPLIVDGVAFLDIDRFMLNGTAAVARTDRSNLLDAPVGPGRPAASAMTHPGRLPPAKGGTYHTEPGRSRLI